jgi:phosphatidylethanolamine-binding protein (PEBP) family uncharacterized protein
MGALPVLNLLAGWQVLETAMSTASLPWLMVAAGLAAAMAPGQASAFSVSFSWAGIPACEKISPAFQLARVPAGTTRLSFEMRDLDVPGFHHGGSTVVYDGEMVKQGAIKYIGPCPPAGQRHRYRWTIEAIDASGEVLATTTVTQRFPP